MSDKVNHPEHYRKHPSGVECIQVTEHMGFCLGNAVKYIWRAGHKGSAIEDLKKARWYIDRELARLEPSPSDDHHPATIGAEKLDVLLDENATLERVIRRALYVVRFECLARDPSCVLPKPQTLAWAIRKALESVAKMAQNASDKDDAYQLFCAAEESRDRIKP